MVSEGVSDRGASVALLQANDEESKDNKQGDQRDKSENPPDAFFLFPKSINTSRIGPPRLVDGLTIGHRPQGAGKWYERRKKRNGE